MRYMMQRDSIIEEIEERMGLMAKILDADRVAARAQARIKAKKAGEEHFLDPVQQCIDIVHKHASQKALQINSGISAPMLKCVRKFDGWVKDDVKVSFTPPPIAPVLFKEQA